MNNKDPINYMYDLATQRHTETWTGTDYAEAETDIAYGYNLLGELASVTVLKENGATPAAVSASTQYNADGGTSTTTLPNTVYSYDAGGRLTSSLDSATGITTTYSYKPNTNYIQSVTSAASASSVVSSDSYTYRADGLKSGETEYTLNANGTSDTVTLAWNYDALDRLTSETSSDTAGVAALNYTDNYSYDLNSNRVKETIENGSGTVTDTITSSYNADNELTQTVDANNGTTTYGYDANGSQTTVTSPTGTTTNVYDLQGKVISVVNKNTSGVVTGSATYIYDDQGNRIEVTTVTGSNAPVTTYYLVDSNNPTGYAQTIEQSATAGTPAATYIWGETLISQNDAPGTTNAGTYYLIADAHGSTQLLLNSTAGVVQTYSYDSSGNALGFTPSSSITPYLYNQQFFDIISGQYYLRSRNYDPATGTFTQQDSINLQPGDLANANFYLYAGADPINMFDPTGMGVILNALLGTSVHSFLNRAFEGFTTIMAGFPAVGGGPGPRLRAGPGTLGNATRWANRRIRTIARYYGNPRSSNILRPDFLQVTRTAGALAGPLYELKPLGITGLFTAAASLFTYNAALNISVPNVSWSLGRSWAPGLTEWPSFNSRFAPPGSRLFTYDNYSLFPGAVFYYVVGVDDVSELVAMAATGAYAVANYASSLQAVTPALDYAATAATTVEAADAAALDDVIATIGISDSLAIAA